MEPHIQVASRATPKEAGRNLDNLRRAKKTAQDKHLGLTLLQCSLVPILVVITWDLSRGIQSSLNHLPKIPIFPHFGYQKLFWLYLLQGGTLR
jgi:hypothetical protein